MGDSACDTRINLAAQSTSSHKAVENHIKQMVNFFYLPGEGGEYGDSVRKRRVVNCVSAAKVWRLIRVNA